jgi:hypothetical protein
MKVLAAVTLSAPGFFKSFSLEDNAFLRKLDNIMKISDISAIYKIVKPFIPYGFK